MSDNKRRKKDLLGDDDDGGADGATDLGIRVNKAYAARFEHNKQREELHRLQSKYPEEAAKLARKITREAAIAAGQEPPPPDEDDSTEEEEDDGEIPEDTEARIFETLMRIRRKDPAIYQKDVQFFQEEEGEAGEGAEDADAAGKPKSAKSKPLFLKDLIAKQALEYGPGGDSSEDEEGGGAKREGARKKAHPKVYDAEQEGLRKAFLEAVEDVEGEVAEEGLDGVLRLRAKREAAGGEEEEEEEEEGADRKAKRKKKGSQKGSDNGSEFQQLIEAYFGTEGEINPDDMFLKEYIVNKGWVDRDDDYVPSYREVVGEEDAGGEEGVDDEEDEAYLRQVNAFEAKYNFRYEEPGAERIVTHPRVVEGTIRKPEDKRKRQRDAKKQRQEEAEEAAREDVKRLKNLKKQEIESKLGKLRNVAGAAAPAATSLDDVLEGDFDPEEWDKKMAAAFDDAYYDVEEELEGLQEDLDLLGGDMEDSDEEAEEEEEAGSEGGEGEEGGEKRVRFSTLKKKLKEVDALVEEPEQEEDGRKRKADPEAAARQRAELQRLLEDYYKLDYEDNVGGVKTRFRYKEVPASTFGLSVDDILRLDDRSLNQVVGIKRLAPYRDDLAKQRPNYKALEMIKGEKAQFKHQRRQQNWKKDAGHKGADGGRQGGQRWRDKAEVGDAAGAGPGSAAADGSAPAAVGQQRAQDGEERKQRRQEQRKGERPGDDGEKAGPGPGSQAQASKGEPGKKHTHGKKPDRQQRQVDPAQARLASYAVPTLKSGRPHDGQGGQDFAGKKRKREEQPQGKQNGGEAEAKDGPQMSRAQKKNLKRAQKRAEKRQTETVAG